MVNGMSDPVLYLEGLERTLIVTPILKELEIKRDSTYYVGKILRGHSATTWTNFGPILTPSPGPLEWISVDILCTPTGPHGQKGHRVWKGYYLC